MTMLKVPVTPHDHVKGPANAPVTLVEYGDYECPYCGLAHPVVELLRQRYGARLRFVFRIFRSARRSTNAEGAAQTAEFAGAQGQFWEMHDGLFENQDRLGLPLYLPSPACSGSRKRNCAQRWSRDLRTQGARRLPWRRAQRRQRYAVLLHQWRAARGDLRIRRSRRRDRVDAARPHDGVSAALATRRHASIRHQRMSRKSGCRFCEKDMRKQRGHCATETIDVRG